MMVDWAKLDVIDYLRSGALIVAFVVLLMSDKRGKANIRQRSTNNWANAEVVVSFVLGMVFYFFPVNVLEYITTSGLTVLDHMEVQILGAFLVGQAVTTARIQTSIESDALVHSSWLVPRSVGSLSLLVTVTHAHIKETYFTDQHMTFFGLALLLWLIGNIYQLFKADTVGVSGASGDAGQSYLNWYLLLDLFIMLPAMIMTLSHPVETFKVFATVTPSSLTVHLVQAACILVITSSLTTFGALYYDENSVKRELFYGKLVVLGMALPLYALHYWKNNIFSLAGLVVTVVIMSIQTLICYMGYTDQNGKVKTR